MQDQQVQMLSTSDVLQFMSSGTESMVAILHAIFRKRTVQIWEESGHAGFITRQISTALVRHIRPGKDAEHVLVSETCRTELQFFRDRINEYDMSDLATKQFFSKLAPQEKHDTEFAFRESRMQPVDLFECLLPNIHRDIRIIWKIGTAGSNKIFLQRQVLAIVEHSWLSSRPSIRFSACVGIVQMFTFFGLTYTMRYNHNNDGAVLILGMLGLLCSTYKIVCESLQLATFVMEGWIKDYATCNGGALGGTILDVVVLVCLVTNVDSTQLGFRIAFAVAAFLKWMAILYALTPFRALGEYFLPILYTMRRIRAMAFVIFFHVVGGFHAYWSLDVGSLDWFDTLFAVGRFSLLADFDMNELDGTHALADGDTADVGKAQRHWTRILFIIMSFGITIVLMNTFIAAIGNTFNKATEDMNIKFQKNRARVIVHHMAIRDMLYGRRHQRHEALDQPMTLESREGDDHPQRRHLWYCDKKCG